MNIALSDDLERLLRKKVENGQFPNKEAVVEQALRLFLLEEPDLGQASMTSVTALEKQTDEEARPWRGVYALEFRKRFFSRRPSTSASSARRVATPRSHKRETGSRRR